MTIPLYKNLTTTVLRALKILGGSASIKDIERVSAELLNLTEEDRNIIHKGKQTKLHNRLTWARYYLKMKGYIENSDKSNYVLTEKGKARIK
ncbi:winged helix-turn-helix domain-containing protein [Candidatus Gracilibacteria bacterium]|nr:winged helix-turn-helix domain-containing protein [Candidatus Gracilibacteria bacterium]